MLVASSDAEALRLIHGMTVAEEGRPTLLGDIFKVADAALSGSPRLMASRELVYRTIDGERDYQDAASADPARPDMVQQMSMGEIILAAEHALAEARRAWYSDSRPYPATIEYLRKVGGLVVKAMEQFGVVERKRS
jgi:hypothetical protein